MSDTYFESWNGDYFQLSDSTRLLHIVRHDRIVVNTFEKQLHGVVLEDGIAGVSYFVNNATLWISPVTTYQGQRVQYVTSDSDKPIDIYYWSYDFFEPMVHGAGIELCNAQGQVVFNSNGTLGSFVKSYVAGVTSYQKVLALQDTTKQYQLGEVLIYDNESGYILGNVAGLTDKEAEMIADGNPLVSRYGGLNKFEGKLISIDGVPYKITKIRNRGYYYDTVSYPVTHHVKYTRPDGVLVDEDVTEWKEKTVRKCHVQVYGEVEQNDLTLPTIGGYWTTKGFSNLYFAIASRFWGVYNYAQVSEEGGKGKKWGFIPVRVHNTYSSDKGYWYNSPSRPLFASTDGNPHYEVAYRVAPNRCDMYQTGLYGYISNKSYERVHVEMDVEVPHFDWVDPKNPDEDGYYVENGTEIKHIDKWENQYYDSFVTVDDRWCFDGSPSCSIMMPFSIWLPAILSEKGNKDIVHAVGVKFYTTGSSYRIELDDHLETLYVSNLSGGGSLDHLNQVQYSSHEEEVDYPEGVIERTEDDKGGKDSYTVKYNTGYPDGKTIPVYSVFPDKEMVEGRDFKWVNPSFSPAPKDATLKEFLEAQSKFVINYPDYYDEIYPHAKGKGKTEVKNRGKTKFYQRIANGCLTEGVSCDICLAHVVST